MDKYKELIEELRIQSSGHGAWVIDICNRAADAIEDLMESSANFEELWHQAMEMRNNDGVKSIEERIEDFPSAQPKIGKWVWLSSTYDRTPCEMRFWCSQCHHEFITHNAPPLEKYCPNCGVKMEEDT